MFQKVNKSLYQSKNFYNSSNRRKIALFFKIYMFFVPNLFMKMPQYDAFGFIKLKA